MTAGQLIFRDAGRHSNGKRLMMVCGVIGVPDEFPLKGEHQYTVGVTELTDLVSIAVLPETAIDRTERIRGWGLGATLTEPMWKI